MTINTEYTLVPEHLHAALLTLAATKSDAAVHMINTGGLALTQPQVERAIDLIIEDLAGELVLASADYASLLARHQAASPTVALRVLKASTSLLLHKRELEINEQLVIDATAEWMSLTAGQRAAIVNLKSVADEGVLRLEDRNAHLEDVIAGISRRRQAS